MSFETATQPGGAALGVVIAAGFVAGGMIAAPDTADARYADLIEDIAPAVVYIETQRALSAEEGGPESPFGEGNPLEKFFERFGRPEEFGQRGPDQGPGRGMPRGVGSGFIISDDGQVVTNNHVVAGAEEVTVKMSDGRSFTAEVVGADPMTDLALLNIEPEVDLPFVEFGDSEKMRVGDDVIAVGNPFGLGGTVTTGIVSATSRNINAGPYDDFIQTDAAINRGNSGGPLFNAEGEVIGVTTAIFSPSGGSVGIGFAVPSDMAQSVIAEIEETGSVERGWLGVQIQDVPPERAEAAGLDEPRGALVAGVEEGGPAAAAGLEPRDVIVSFNGQKIAEMQELPRIVAAVAPGETVDVTVVRDGETRTLSAELAVLNREQLAASSPEPQPEEQSSDELGAELAALSEAAREQLGLGDGATGVLVKRVDPSGPAAGKLLQGDVITEIDGEAVETPGGAEEILAAQDGGEAVMMRVTRDGASIYVGLRLKTS